MSGLGFNKAAGAVLATGLAILGLREVSSLVYHTEPPERPGYRIEGAEALMAAAGGAAAAAALPVDWGTVLPTADLAAGQSTSARCASCHTFNSGGPNGIGPNLYGVVGGPVGAHAGFDYSPAMRAHAGEAPRWTLDELDAFITAPQRHVNGTRMTYAGIRNTDDRVALIAWMRTQSASPLAIPAPDPARQAGAAPAPGAVPVAAGETPAGAAEQNPAGEGTSAQASGAAATPQTPPAPQPGGGPNNQAPATGAAAAPSATVNRNPGGDPARN